MVRHLHRKHDKRIRVLLDALDKTVILCYTITTIENVMKLATMLGQEPSGIKPLGVQLSPFSLQREWLC